jgi:uncharacterized protein YutE (UPF0331/DUF86 family)
MILHITESGTGGRPLVLYDEEKVTALSSNLVQACERLHELGRMQKETVVSDPHLIASAKYHLIVGIEAAIDLAHHLIAKNRWRAPEDYADTFRIMEEHHVVDAEFSARLQRMSRFRNRLIHIYWDIDDETVYNLLQEDVCDIEEFLTRYLQALRAG